MAASHPPATVVSSQLDWRETRLKLGKWLLFEVTFALIPLGFNWCGALIHGGQADAEAILGRGELLLVGSAIVAASIGDVVNKGLNSRLRGTKQLLIGVGMLLIVAATWLYAEAATTPGETPLENVAIVVSMSFYLIVAALLLSMACLIVAEVK